MRGVLCAGVALATLTASLARAEGPVLPSGGQVVAGMATITAGPAALSIQQASSRAVIDWAGFSIGAGGAVHFANGAGATLNRVQAGDVSRIAGELSATGSLYLINPAGVVVDAGGRVLTGGHFIASSRALAADSFMAGNLTLAGSGSGAIRNLGQISAGGDVVLFGAQVNNGGRIEAGGRAVLAAGERLILKNAGDDGRFSIEGAGAGVATSGLISAAQVQLEAVGGNVYALAGNTDGTVRATGAAMRDGRVWLVGKAIDVAGAITARNADGSGGRIWIGGERQGLGTMERADTLVVAATARIDASAQSGRGGEVILWSEQQTRFEGLILADGPGGGGFVETSSRGALGIDAGRVQVGNGEWLLDPRDVIIQIGGFTLAPPHPGTIQIDPPDAAGAYVVNALGLVSALNAGSRVTVTTTQPSRSDAGNITVASALSWTGSGQLRLLADNDILINAGIAVGANGSFDAIAVRDIITSASISGQGNANLGLQAGRNVTVNSTMGASGNGTLTLDAGNLATINTTAVTTTAGALSIIGRGAGIAMGQSGGNRRIETASGALSLSAPGSNGDIIITRTSSFNNIQVFSGSGALSLDAGRDVRIQGSGLAGGWTRIGRLGTTAPVTVTAGRNVTITANPGLNDAFAEIVGSNTLAVTAANRIDVTRGSRSDAGITGNGAATTITATAGTFAGRLASLGETTLNGSYLFTVSPTLNLNPNFGFTSNGPIEATVPLAVRTSGTGDVSINAAVTGTTLLAIAGDQFNLNAAITMSGTGNPLVLVAGQRFNNGAGANALSAPNDRWLTYSVSPLTDTGGSPGAAEFNLYGRSYAANPPAALGFAGNRRVFSLVPTLTLTAPTDSKTYGDVYIGSASVAGLIAGDNLADALTAAPVVTSAGAPAPAGVGSYATSVAATASAQGYQLVIVDGTLTVNPAALSVTALAGSKIYGDADPALTFNATGFRNGEGPGVLSGSLTRAAGEDVGAYAIGQGSLANPNYVISFTTADFNITPAPLSITALAASKLYGSIDPALDFDAQGFRRGDTAATALTGALARAAGENVGTYGINQGSLAAGNYTINFTPADFTITRAALTITALPATKLYGQADPLFGFTTTGLVAGDVLTGALGRDPGETVGTYALRQGTLNNPNYAISFRSANLAINPAPLTIIANPLGKIYGDGDPLLTFSATGFAFGETAAVLSGTLARNPGENAGIYAITQGNLSASNYAIAFTSANFTIDPATLTVIASDAAKRFGDADPALNYAASGFRRGDLAADVLTGNVVRAAGENVGNYAITQGSLTVAAGNNNYVIAFTPGNFAITTRVLQITALDRFKIYGSADPALDFTDTGYAPGDDRNTVLTGALARTTGENVGLYAVVQGTLAVVPAQSGNYSISFAPAFFTINPAQLTITADPASREYGLADTIPFSFTASGLINNAIVSDTVATAITGALGRDPGENVGLYALRQGSLAARNYQITFVSADLAITPAPLMVVAGNSAKIYGDADPASFAFMASGFRNGDSANILTGALARAAGENAGVYAINQNTLAAGSNYVISYTAGQFTINRRPLSVMASDTGKIYGTADPALAFTTGTLVAGDTPATAFTGAIARAAGENAGDYGIGQGTLASQNYAIDFTPGVFRISAAGLIVTPLAATREYGLADPLFGFTTSGLVAGDTAASVLSGLLGRDAGENVGLYTIRQGSLVANGNYSLSIATGAQLAITPAPLAIAANAATRRYGDADPALGFQATGLRNGDSTAIITGSLLRDRAGQAGDPARDAVGIYAIGQGSVNAGGNYTISYTPADFTITARPLTVIALDASKTYGDADPALGFTAPGLLAGDSLVGSLSRDSGENVAASPYAITQGTLANPNYAIAFTPGALTITPALLSLTADDKSVVYGQPLPALTVQAGPGQLKFADTLADILTGSAASDGNLNAGTHPIGPGTLALATANYVFDPDVPFTNGTLTITPAPLSVVATNLTKIYGDADPQLSFTATGLIGSDTLAGALARAAGETVAGGPYAITQGTLANPNYAITFTAGALSITPATLTIAANSLSKVYGTADPLLSFAASGFRLGDTAVDVLSGSLARAPGETVLGGPYAISQGSLAANSNYSISFTGSSFAITPAALAVTVTPGQSKIYGDPDPILAFTATGLIAGDTLAGALTRAPGETVAGGPYAIGQGTLANPNYAISFAGDSFAITPAPLSVTPDNLAKVYGTADPAFSFAATGLKLGDTAAAVLSGSLARVAGESVAGGPYAITAGTLAANSNYALVVSSGAALSITPATLVASFAGPISRVYDGTTAAAPGALLLAGVVGSDRVTATPASAAFDTRNVGSGKLVTASGLLLGGADASNYQLAASSISAAIGTITPAPISVSLVGEVARPYDATATANVAPGNLLISGRIGSDAVTAAVTAASYDTPRSGRGKPVTAGLALSGADAGNYRLGASSVTANIGTITPIPLTVRPLDAARPFGVANPPFALVASGLVGGDTLASIGVGAQSPATPVSPPGVYPIIVTGTPADYVLAAAPGTLTVLPVIGNYNGLEQVVVPVTGGLVQEGAATATNNALPHRGAERAGYRAGDLQPQVMTSRFQVATEPAPLQRGGLGGASAFDPGTP